MIKLATFFSKTAVILMIALLLGCVEDKPVGKLIPNEPASVLRAWQKHVDQSEFVKAKELSTSTAQVFLDGLKKLEEGFLDGRQDTIPVLTNFLALECRTKGDNATCQYTIEIEPNENVTDSIYLVRQAGQWLVDIPEDALEPSKELEKIFEESKKVIQ